MSDREGDLNGLKLKDTRDINRTVENTMDDRLFNHVMKFVKKLLKLVSYHAKIGKKRITTRMK